MRGRSVTINLDETVERRHKPYLKFKAFLVENNIAQTEVAELLGKTRYTLNQKMNGTGADFSLTELSKIHYKYGIDVVEYFLKEKRTEE